MSIRDEKLSNSAYNTIKEKICDGHYAPGSILSIMRLSKNLAMSRTPVREALYRLEAEGFIEVKDGVGAFVKGVSAQDIKNLYAVRAAIETLAAESSIYNISEDWLRKLESDFLQLKEDIDIEKYSNLDRELHQMIVSSCGNGYISSISEMIELNVERYQRFTCKDEKDLPTRIDQHLRMIELIRLKDINMLSLELKNNINFGKEYLLPSTK